MFQSFSESLDFEKEYFEYDIPTVYENNTEQLWNLYFDGASTKEESVASFVFIPPSWENTSLSYKLEFETTNNVDEYEALILGL